MGKVLEFKQPKQEQKKEEFNARMGRIKHSLEQINNLMKELKNRTK